MKRIFAVFSVCLFIAAFAVSQNLKVTEFRLIPNSTLASTHGTEEIDPNGEKCAIIRVVTPQSDFHFDTGLMHLVRQEKHPGEIWLWVSPLLRHLTITHNLFGKCDYDIPITVEGGRTYEMLLDIGTGRFVTITTTVPRSSVIIDGEDVGTSPIYNHYLNMGQHTIVAVNDKHEGTLKKVITTGDENGTVLNVVMEDQSHLYGDVVVKVDGRADIFYNGKKVGTGQWRTQLKEGPQTVETRKADADSQTTTFTVVAGKENQIQAIAPTPHTGYLQIYTRPRNLQATIDGTMPIDLSERQVVPVGTHQIQFQKKGYVTQNHEYTVRRNEMTRDTVTLERVTYVKPLAFYFGGAFAVRTLSGVSGILGAVYKRNDLQASYTFGLSESDIVYWNGDMNTATKYKMQSIGLKYGYQFPLMRQLAITPQVGYYYNFLSASAASAGNTTYGDGAASNALSIGVKLVVVPMQHLYIFAAPEYMFAMSKDNNFKSISNNSNVSGDGFSVHLGLLVNF